MRTKILLILSILLLCYTYGMGQIRCHTTTTRVVATEHYAYLQFPQLKRIWKASYKHVLVLQSKDNLRPFMKLEELLANSEVYTPRNTLIICSGENEAYIKEIAGKIKVLPLDILVLTENGPRFSEGSLSRLHHDAEGYEFKYVPMQIYE